MGRDERSHTVQRATTNQPSLLSLPPLQIEELVCTNEQRTNQWGGFRGWLERRGKQRYNVIIDGANVGYYKACLSEGELADLRQVDWAVKKFQEEVSNFFLSFNYRLCCRCRRSFARFGMYKPNFCAASQEQA